MKLTLIRSKTSDRVNLDGMLYEPKVKALGTILHIHGMAGNFYENKFLDAMAEQYTAAGYAFATVNTRGHDMGNMHEKFSECVYDIEAWLDYLEQLNYRQVVLQGHSLGAVKVAYYVGKMRDVRVTKLILASPPDMIGLAEAEASHAEMVAGAHAMLQEGRCDELLPKLLWGYYYLSAATFLDFFTRGSDIDIFNTYMPGARSILAEIQEPIFALYGSRDDAVLLSPNHDLDIIKKKASSCPRFDSIVIEGASHDYRGSELQVTHVVLKWLHDSKL